MNRDFKSISIVTPVYKSQIYISEFVRRYTEVLKNIGLRYEIIFVNDGSPDQSKQTILEQMSKDKNIVLVQLSRNFGQAAAVQAGLDQAKGDLCLVTDCDLEEDPVNLQAMYTLLCENSEVDLVYGVQPIRQGNFFRKISGGLFYFLFDYISEVKIPKNQVWQRLMTKKYRHALLTFREGESLPAGLMALAGFKQIPVVVHKKLNRVSSYSMGRRINLAFNSMISFSSRPLILISLFGFCVSFVSSVSMLFLILRKLFDDHFQAGWASLMVSIWFLSGVILFSVGVVGIYVSKIFNQVKQRPNYLVSEVLSSGQLTE